MISLRSKIKKLCQGALPCRCNRKWRSFSTLSREISSDYSNFLQHGHILSYLRKDLVEAPWLKRTWLMEEIGGRERWAAPDWANTFQWWSWWSIDHNHNGDCDESRYLLLFARFSNERIVTTVVDVEKSWLINIWRVETRNRNKKAFPDCTVQTEEEGEHLSGWCRAKCSFVQQAIFGNVINFWQYDKQWHFSEYPLKSLDRAKVLARWINF